MCARFISRNNIRRGSEQEKKESERENQVSFWVENERNFLRVHPSGFREKVKLIAFEVMRIAGLHVTDSTAMSCTTSAGTSSHDSRTSATSWGWARCCRTPGSPCGGSWWSSPTPKAASRSAAVKCTTFVLISSDTACSLAFIRRPLPRHFGRLLIYDFAQKNVFFSLALWLKL